MYPGAPEYFKYVEKDHSFQTREYHTKLELKKIKRTVEDKMLVSLYDHSDGFR